MPTQLKKWTDREARKEAILKILKKSQIDDDFRRHCLSSPEYVRQAFVDMCRMDVPGDVIVSFVPEGDRDNGRLRNSGSVVLEVPPGGATDDTQLIDYVRCTYIEWLRATDEN